MQKGIFFNALKQNEKFVGFCEITNDNTLSEIYDVYSFYEVRLSNLSKVDFGQIDNDKLIIILDTDDRESMHNLNLSREILFKKFKKVLFVSRNKQITNIFINNADDLFSWIQNHLVN